MNADKWDKVIAWVCGMLFIIYLIVLYCGVWW